VVYFSRQCVNSLGDINLLPFVTLPRRVAIARGFLLCWASALWLISLACVGFAKPDFPPIVRTTLAPKAGGAVEKANNSCQMCHTPSPPKLNPYGTDLKGALQQAKSKVLTPEALKAIEAKDSDGDGFPNSAEYAADTLPNDPASKPAGPPPSAPNSTPTAAAESPGLFSVKTLLTPDHAQHPVIVHFPIALFIISLLFEVFGLWKRNEGLRQAAYFNLIAAAVSSPLAIITGIIAWQVKFGGAPLAGELLWHLVSAITSSVLLFAVWWTRVQMNKKPGSGFSKLYFILSMLLFMLISLTGHLGGALVYGT
jgi:uncharacterized membrane protein